MMMDYYEPRSNIKSITFDPWLQAKFGWAHKVQVLSQPAHREVTLTPPAKRAQTNTEIPVKVEPRKVTLQEALWGPTGAPRTPEVKRRELARAYGAGAVVMEDAAKGSAKSVQPYATIGADSVRKLADKVQAVAVPTGPTMTSLEIAERTEKEHKHILRDIRLMLAALGKAESSFGLSYTDPTGRALPMFALPKDLTITLVSGYSVRMRHAIVTRWQELEEQLKAPATAATSTPVDLTSAASLRGLLLGYTEQVLALDPRLKIGSSRPPPPPFEAPASAPITISNIFIRQDSEGRYCLNDLHRAAGGLSKHKPANWDRSESVRELISEIQQDRRDRCSEMSIAPWVSVSGGHASGQGTFVCKELVYAYAMWISAKFHLQVIRAYDQLVTQAPPPAPAVSIPGTYAEALRLAAGNYEAAEAAKAQLAITSQALAVAEPKAGL